MVLTSSSPGGSVFLVASVLIYMPNRLRRDRSRPGDVYAIGNGIQNKDNVMNIVVTSALKQSCLSHATKSSDYVIRGVESVKFREDARSIGSI